MIADNLSTSQKRNFAIGLMILTLLTITLGVVKPMVGNFTENKDRITRLQQQLTLYHSHVISQPVLISQTAELKNDILGTGIFSLQKSTSLVLAELQEKLKSTITSAGGELISTQSLTPKTVDGLIKLGINASFSGKIRSLKTVFYELESAKPYMMFENIKIYGTNNLQGSNGNIDTTNKIMVIADIVTYIPPIPK